MTEVANAIINNIEQRCQCMFTRSYITSGLDGFRCFSESTDAVTYRAEIQETDTANVFDLIKYIEDWTAGEVLIRIGGVFIEVDSSCRVAIESIEERECLPRNGSSIVNASSNNSIYIGGGVAAVLCFLLLLAIIAIVVTLIMKRRKASYKLGDTLRRYSAGFCFVLIVIKSYNDCRLYSNP